MTVVCVLYVSFFHNSCKADRLHEGRVVALWVQQPTVMRNPTHPEDDGPESRYSNIFRIGYNAYEFIFDFGQYHPPDQERMHTRIVTSPSSAKNLSMLLQDSLGEHEQKYNSERPKE